MTAPPPLLKPAAPAVELLDEPPPALTRPLDLVTGVAYAATWLWVKKTIREETAKNGEIVRLDPPKVIKARELFVIAGNGKIYGPGGDDDVRGARLRCH